MKIDSRRGFLKNTALAAFTTGILPSALNAKHENHPIILDECNPTTLDLYGEGPFYTANPPDIKDNLLAPVDEQGTRLIISGVVRTLNCTSVIPNAKIDLWHANDAGEYDNSGYKLRGVTYSNAQGFYMFETIYPGKYLNGAQFRPSHIHVKVTPPGFSTLTTQIYFEGDDSIPTDVAASVTSGTYDARARIIPLDDVDGKFEGSWDIIVDGTTDFEGIHIDKGIIYSAMPNPFKSILHVNYGVFRAAKVSLEVFDIHGKKVANLGEYNREPEKYKVYWEAGSDLPSGTYIIVLKVNDLQVNHMKVIKV